MDNPAPEESTYKDLTDEQCFRQMVESFVEMRSENEKRRFPRFPTPEALSGKVGVEGFEGILVCEEGDSSGDSIRTPEEKKSLGGVDDRSRKINIVDFSEDGVQLRLSSNDLLCLQGRSLYLEIQDFRLPVRFKWCMHNGFDGEGGFSFVRKIDSDQHVARFISTLNTRLIDFLINEYRENPATFTRQAGIFIYFNIYYGLRLKFLEMVSEINHLTNTAEAEYPSAVQEVVRQTFSGFNYSSVYHREQISKNISDPRLKKLLHIYMKPFYAYGCGIPGMRQSTVFLRDDAWAAILSSVFFAEADCRTATKILPSLLSLHQSFLHLKQLLPGVLEEEELDNQFRYYSKTIFEMELLRERVVDYLSSHGETDGSSSEKDAGTETPREDLPREVVQVLSEGPTPSSKKMPRVFQVLVLVAVVAVAAFFFGLWFGRGTELGVISPRVETAAILQTAPIMLPPDRVVAPSGNAASSVAGKEIAEPGDVTSSADTPAPGEQGAAAPEEWGPKDDKPEELPAPPKPLEKHLFEIAADQEAWVQVKIDNKTNQSALLKPGEKREWEVKQNMRILLGNAGGVRMKWDGVAFGPLGRQGEPVRFQLPDPKYTGESKSSPR